MLKRREIQMKVKAAHPDHIFRNIRYANAKVTKLVHRSKQVKEEKYG